MRPTSFLHFIGALALSVAFAACYSPAAVLAARGGGGGGGGGRGGFHASGGSGSVQSGGRAGGMGHNDFSRGGGQSTWNGRGGDHGNWSGTSSNWKGQGSNHGKWNQSNWDGHGHWDGNWNGHGNWNGYGNWYGPGWRPYVYWPLWYPYVSVGFYGGYGGGYGYPYDYYYDNAGPYQAAYPPDAEEPATVADEGAPEQGMPQSDFGDPALKAFGVGNYREAARLAQHWTVDAPQSAKAHELLSLALFASGEYRGAAIEAHAALHFGPVADWPTLYHYYNDVDRYSQQADALAKYAREHKQSPEAQFLLGYHNLMMGHKKVAAEGFAKALALAPKDEIARKMVGELSGAAPALPPPPPLPPVGTSQAPAASTAPSSNQADDSPPPEPQAAVTR